MRAICKKYVLVTLLLLIGFTSILYTQPYYFRHYQVENGLSNNAAITCLQDKKGFIWFGTKDGLNRFDGYTFKIFRNDPQETGTIGNNFIHCLWEDYHGVLWVGTEKGLYSYNDKTETFSLLPSTETLPIADVKMDSKGNLWFIQLANFNLYKYVFESRKTYNYPVSNYFEASSICIANDGALWVSSPTGFINRYDAETNNFKSYNVFNHSGLVSSTWIEKIYGSKNGMIFIGTSNGAKIFDLQTLNYKDILTNNPDKTEIFVRNFLENDTNEIWIASETGIHVYNKETGVINNLQKTYNDPYSISDNAVYTFCKDKEGGIWAGTYFGGINYYAKQHTAFKKYFPKTGGNSLSGNVVREIHADNDGNLWIGTEDAALNKYNPATGTYTVYKPTGSNTGLSYSNIHGLLVNNDELWVGTFEHGLDIMSIKTGKVIRHYSMGPADGDLKSNFIFCITKNASGDILIGTARGAYTYNPEKDNFTQLPAMPVTNWYSYLLHDHQKKLWAATYGNGVIYYDSLTNQLVNFTHNPADKTSIANDRVNSIYEDSTNNLWFATENGLSKFDGTKKTFKTYTTTNGFPSNFILSILEDSKKNLWVSTSKGLVCFNPETELSKIFTRVNGILNDQFNFNSAFKDDSGTMYFGSVKGMISFKPEAFSNNEFIPPVYITGLQVFNKELPIAQEGSPLQKSISYTDKITLGYDQSTISIDFAGLSYTAPEMAEYAYKLEGIDRSWTYLKRNRKAYFTDLSPGTYVFKVKASNSSGLWNEKETSLTIQILPPWWASFWAYSFYVLVALLVVYFSIRSYHRRIEVKNRRRYELLEIAKEKEIFAAKIEFFTNVAHEIKTPLTLIKAPLEKVIKKAEGVPEIMNNLKIMDRNTNRLIELTNQLLDFRQTELQGFSLSFVRMNISELLEEIFHGFKSLAEQKNINFQLSLPAQPVFAYVDLDAFTKIIYNLFSNAVKYADTKVDIVLLPYVSREQSFSIDIKNDGYIIPYEMKEKVFEPFYRLKETEKQKGTGIGLALSRSLAQLHNGTLVLKYPEADMNVFCVTLPIHQQNEFNLSVSKKNLSKTSNNPT